MPETLTGLMERVTYQDLETEGGMNMLKIDAAGMSAAIAGQALESTYRATGFLNRNTGEIKFLANNEGDLEEWTDQDTAIENVFDRAHVTTHPEEWIEIRRYHHVIYSIHGPWTNDDFIREFLEENGIAAQLV